VINLFLSEVVRAREHPRDFRLFCRDADKFTGSLMLPVFRWPARRGRRRAITATWAVIAGIPGIVKEKVHYHAPELQQCPEFSRSRRAKALAARAEDPRRRPHPGREGLSQRHFTARRGGGPLKLTPLCSAVMKSAISLFGGAGSLSEIVEALAHDRRRRAWT
jgi:hypothetical protein